MKAAVQISKTLIRNLPKLIGTRILVQNTQLHV
jgi:hypothetical protein